MRYNYQPALWWLSLKLWLVNFSHGYMGRRPSTSSCPRSRCGDSTKRAVSTIDNELFQVGVLGACLLMARLDAVTHGDVSRPFYPMNFVFNLHQVGHIDTHIWSHKNAGAQTGHLLGKAVCSTESTHTTEFVVELWTTTSSWWSSKMLYFLLLLPPGFRCHFKWRTSTIRVTCYPTVLRCFCRHVVVT